MLANRVPYNVSRNVTASFPGDGTSGSATFMTKQEFDFIANETSFHSLMDEASRYLATSPQQLEREVELFRESVNRAPDTFRVPDDNGDRFFQKMNLGLYLVNRSRPQDRKLFSSSTTDSVERVLEWMSTQINSTGWDKWGNADSGNSEKTAKQAAEALKAKAGGGDTELFNELVKIDRSIAEGSYPKDVPDYFKNTFQSANVKTAFNTAADLTKSLAFQRLGKDPDLLRIFIMNLFPSGPSGGVIGAPSITSVADAPPKYDPNVQPNPSSASVYQILFNIGARLQKDAFYRENNFKEILEEIGMSTEQFAKLVENSVTTIYWPDCVASKNTEDEIRYLVKGLGIDDPATASMNKIQLCSYILTSVGLKPTDFGDPTFNLNDRLGNENVKNLKRIILMLRKPGANAPGDGYLGFDNNLGIPVGNKEITDGAFVMTGYTAHNVTMDKATQWLAATNVNVNTQVTFKNYSDNQNMFDLLSSRKGAPKPIAGQMDFTKAGIEKRMTRGNRSVLS